MFKKIWWILVVSFSLIIFYGLLTSLIHNNIGSTADWLSGAGAIIAIFFAYLQISEQRKEYQNDKRKEKEEKKANNKPYFSVIQRYMVKTGKEIAWANSGEEYHALYLMYSKNNKETSEFYQGYLYEFKNVTNNTAFDIVLKIDYFDIDLKQKYTDIICTYTSVTFKENILFLPKKIFANYKKTSKMSKNIYLFYKSIDGIYYREMWKEKIKEPENDFQMGGLILEFVEIKEVDSADVPKQKQAVGYLMQPIEDRIYSPKSAEH